MTVSQSRKLISIVVPVYNEAAGLRTFHESLVQALKSVQKYDCEVIYCDDGSTDDTKLVVRELAAKDKRVRLLCLTRNFGKEMATTAGLRLAGGAAVITIDGDGQHPAVLITELVNAWEAGAKVVVGRRRIDAHDGFVKAIGSRLFYRLMRRFSGVKMVPRSTDFRLVDREVQQLFSVMSEHNRITRGLIDWLGYPQHFIEFKPANREFGEARYTLGKLFKLAIDSVISSSPTPLYFIAFLGVLILPIAALLALIMVVNALAGDPLAWHATGTAYIAVGLLFLVGLVMLSQGIIGLYLSHIHSETQNRPLYIIDKEASIGL